MKKAINTSQLKNRQSNCQTTQSNQVQVKTSSKQKSFGLTAEQVLTKTDRSLTIINQWQ